ncbi:MAG TPA: hypothetical protein VKK81_18215, partial [Candidatus Binatia bacterium]|nr:hypothetical protein [Candidatus Binatia bacterium]
MTFVEDARNFLRRDFLPQITSLLGQEDYAHRLIFRQGVEVDKARAFRAFREDRESTGDLLEDQELDKQPRLLLIGDAGSGKSFILAFAYLQAAQRFLKNLSAPFPLFLDLDKDLPTQLNIQGLEEALEYKHKGFFRRALTESPTGYAFFFDSLDEVLQTAPRFVNDLEFFLQKHHERLTHVLVACRRAMWNPQRFSTGLAQLAVYHADHLGWEEYAQILPDRTSQQAFFTQCNDLGIESLLETPFDDFYLAREFRAGRPLPRTRHDCLNQRITAALQGRENDRRDGQSAPLDRLRFLARQLACLTSFLPHHAWTEQNVIDLLGSSEVLRLDQPVQPQEVQTLLRRPLFRRTDDRFAFTHQLYQEFLAAEALGPLPLRKQRQLLESSRPELNRIRPPYRGIAMCLAESSEVFCRYLLTSDALVALFAELSSLSSEQDEEL